MSKLIFGVNGLLGDDSSVVNCNGSTVTERCRVSTRNKNEINIQIKN